MFGTRLRIRLSSLLLIIAGATLATAVSAQAAPHTSTGPPPPSKVAGVLESNATVQLTWTPPAWPAAKLGGYLVLRNDTQIAKLPTTGSGGPTSYTDPRPTTGTVVYTVETYSTTGADSAPSTGAQLTVSGASSSGSAAKPLAPGSTNITAPNFRQGNAPTAFEQYGQAAGQIHQTYGFFGGEIEGYEIMPLQILWYGTTEFAYLALTFLAWGMTRSFYAPLIAVTTALVQAYFHLPLFGIIMTLAMVFGAAGAGLYLFRRHLSAVAKNLGLVLVAVGIMMAYTSAAPTWIQNVINAPVQVGDYTLGLVNQILPAQDGNFGLQIHPTYNGDPFEQGVRRFQEKEWVDDVYPAVCALNFSDVAWSTSHFVPNDGSLPTGWGHLTYCEFYVKDVAAGGANDSYLTSAVHANAPADVWDAFQGNNMGKHYFTGGLAMLVIWVRGLFIDLLAFAFALGEILAAIGMVKWAIIGVGAAIPQIRPYITSALARWSVSLAIPCGLAVLAIISLAFSDIGYTVMLQTGWAAMEVMQLVMAIGAFTTALMMWRHHRKMRSIRLDGLPAPSGGGGSAAVATGATIAGAAIASGGTAALMTAAAQPAVRRREDPPEIGGGGYAALPRRRVYTATAEQAPAPDPNRPAITTGQRQITSGSGSDGGGGGGGGSSGDGGGPAPPGKTIRVTPDSSVTHTPPPRARPVRLPRQSSLFASSAPARPISRAGAGPTLEPQRGHSNT